MNIYDDMISLPEECANAFISSLLTDKKNFSNRNAFIADVEPNVSFSEDGKSIVVDVADINIDDKQLLGAVDTLVNTRKTYICVNASITVNTAYLCNDMRSYAGTESNSGKCVVREKAKKNEWNKMTQALNDVA